jgi:hypothetical protein
MAWAGDDADRTHPRGVNGPSGFELAARAVEQIAWLRDLVQAAARRVRDEPGDPRGRPTYSRDAKLDAIRRLAPAYEKAFGRRMGVTRRGPAIRFLQAFFEALGERLGPAALANLISESRRRA